MISKLAVFSKATPFAHRKIVYFSHKKLIKNIMVSVHFVLIQGGFQGILEYAKFVVVDPSSVPATKILRAVSMLSDIFGFNPAN